MISAAKMSIAQIEEVLRANPIEAFIQECMTDPRQGVHIRLQRYLKQQESQTKEQERIESLLVEEKKLQEEGLVLIAGMDEAGRGPLAGPVVAAACILPKVFALPSLNDSKKLTALQRALLYEKIRQEAVDFAVGSADPEEIDRYNILQATCLAMKRAVEGLKEKPHFLLIDAVELPTLNIPQKAIIGGDGISANIAAASILAKVTRDRWMEELHEHYPQYGFVRNKGYGTKEHLEALKLLGPCPIHRHSFAPVYQSK